MDPDLDSDTYQDQEPAIFVIDLTDSKKNNLFLYFSVPIFQIVQLRNFTNIKSLNKSKNCSNPILIWDAQKKVEGWGRKKFLHLEEDYYFQCTEREDVQEEVREVGGEVEEGEEGSQKVK
jgi:capsule polysaccharide export protein KpsC/LpsZ